MIQAAVDEDRDGLKDAWVRLLAAATDPDRAHLVRLAFIDVLKRMDPLDPIVLQSAQGHGGHVSGETKNKIAMQVHASLDEVDVSVSNLLKLELLVSTIRPSAGIGALGREFLRVVSD